MEEIKSALEKALEKAERLGKPSEEDLVRWKHLPEGQKLAARYLKEGLNLLSELGKYQDKARRWVVQGAQEVLLRNLELPRNDVAKKKNKSIMEALKLLKEDKARVENVYSKLRRIFAHYEQEGAEQRRQAYEGLKREFEAKLQQQMQAQLGSRAVARVNVESLAQFREEWRKFLAQLDSQYEKLLEEYRQEISHIP